MSTIEMKYQAFNLLMRTKKDSVVKQIMEILIREDDNAIEERSEELKDALKQSEKSFKDGRFSSHEDVMERMKNKFPNLHK